MTATAVLCATRSSSTSAITVTLGLSAPQVRERQLAVAFDEGSEHLLLKSAWILIGGLPGDA